jgi:hypothetical protein
MPRSRHCREFPRPLALVLVAAVLGGCAGQTASGVGLIPRPPADQLELSKTESVEPYALVREGLATRTAFRATSGAFTIEVRDLLVSPGRPAVSLDLGGAAVFEVRDGAGVADIAGKEITLSMGATFAVSQGEPVRVQARGGPLALRAHLLTPQ